MLESDLQGGLNGSDDINDDDLENLDGTGFDKNKEEVKNKDASLTKTSLN